MCWGADSYGRSSVPNNGLTYIDIGAGANHTCALTTAGEVICWGQDYEGQASPPNKGLSYTALSVGHDHNCALSATDDVFCWGQDQYKQVSVPSPYPPLAWSPDYGIDHALLMDLTGDGYLDLLVSDSDASTSGTDPFSGPYTISQHGKIWVIPGSASGFSGEYDLDIDATHTITGTTDNFEAGLDLINAGDINGDGFDDLISNGKLYYGPLTPGDTPAEQLDAELPSNDVHPVGDTNNDGYEDFFVDEYLHLGQPN